MTSLAVASFVAFGSLLVLFGANSTEIIRNLGLDYASFGLVGSTLSLGLGLGIVSSGPITDRLPRRPLYMTSCAIVLSASISLSPNTSYASLLLHTFAIGFGAGFYETVLNALIVEEFGSHAPRRLIFVHAAATFSAAITPLAFEGLRTATPLAWYDTFRLVGLIHFALILGSLFVRMRPSPRKTRDTASGRAEERQSDDRVALAAVCLAAFAYVGTESAISLFVADYTTSNLGLDAGRAAQSISAFWGGLLVGRLAIGFSPRAPGAGTTGMLALCAALVIGLFGAGFLTVPEFAIALVGFFLGGVFPVMIGLAGLALPSSAGVAVGLAGGLGSLGGFAIPWLTGRLAEEAGLSFALTSLTGWLLVLSFAAGIVRWRAFHRATPPSA